MVYINNHGNVKKLFGGSDFQCGFYAWIEENGALTIGEERGREGGTLYCGAYKGENTPWLNEVKKENIKLYNNIVKYCNEHSDDVPEFANRSRAENCRFYEHIASAIDNAEQAISNITYSAYPELNKDVIDKIKNACEILDDILDDMNIMKPIGVCVKGW